jgi:hypothetical protein
MYSIPAEPGCPGPDSSAVFSVREEKPRAFLPILQAVSVRYKKGAPVGEARHALQKRWLYKSSCFLTQAS